MALEAKELIGIHDRRNAERRTDRAIENVALFGHSLRLECLEVFLADPLAVFEMKAGGRNVADKDETNPCLAEGRGVVVAVGDCLADVPKSANSDALTKASIPRFDA